jgi:flagellar basal-body rod modification protein FlgD
MVAAVTSSTPSTSSASGTANDAATLTSNYTTFLNLLTAQIKNQDPLSPMDTTQWTNQLVQYSSVEQQLKANQYLESLVNAGSQSSMNQAVGYIGKAVTANVDTATLNGGQASWQYALGGDATTATLTVKDSNGNVVWSGDAPDKSAGMHSFTWDGATSSGAAAPAGDYTLSVAAKTVAGDVTAAVGLSGVVSSVQNNSGAVELMVNGTAIPLSSISTVAATS